MSTYKVTITSLCPAFQTSVQAQPPAQASTLALAQWRNQNNDPAVCGKPTFRVEPQEDRHLPVNQLAAIRGVKVANPQKDSSRSDRSLDAIVNGFRQSQANNFAPVILIADDKAAVDPKDLFSLIQDSKKAPV